MLPILWSINLFVLSAVVCATILFVYTAKRLEIALAALIGLALGAFFHIPATFPPTWVMIWLGWWGVGGLLTTSAAIYCTRTDRDARIRLVQNMLFPPVAAVVGSFLVAASAKLTPFTLDRYLYAADGSFGFQPGFAAQALLVRHEWLRLATGIAYINLPVLMTMLYLLLNRRNPADASRLIRVLSAVGIAGYCLYYFFPAAGSEVVLGSQFPFHPPPVASFKLEPIPVGLAPRNFMPSLHTAWCLAICWAARGLTRVWRTIVMAIVVLTLVYTLCCHYLVDMVAAVPFTLAVYAVVENRMPWNHPARRLAVGSGAACFGAWLIALRFGTSLFLISPVVIWMASAFTVVLCWYCLYAEPNAVAGTSAAGAGDLSPALSPRESSPLSGVPRESLAAR
jgi:hypothetical protein